MPEFSTPQPISVSVEVAGVRLGVRATAAATTTVEVRPHNPGRPGDVALAGQIVVDYAAGRLTVRSPRPPRTGFRIVFGGNDRVDVDLELPAGSALEVRGWGDVTAHGRLGAVDIETGAGDITLDRVEQLRAKTSAGNVRVSHAAAVAELRTAAGSVRVDRADAELDAATAAGDVVVEAATAPLRLATSAGRVRVGRATTDVRANTSAGDIRLGSVAGGTVTAAAAFGGIEVGVAEGTAAWLDVQARLGAVRSDLESAGEPEPGEPTVRIHATAGVGDIVLRRA
ncbi:DUF4097 family beta strand repeat-containing protein [Skermania piniformis]|uniref:DUF4097 domain-containing protein n=1 Tax=Skermania pinensis TaxID=39122 RepID=A0ABX8SB89_9ACTN|nr:DUF4097 family beta strand repeat-containing protein [Skermania piniformis]QXQ13710.1 DUF4097 domain-containing protein [Skermania piniformis]